MKNIRNLFKLKKENKTIKDKILSDIRNLFELKNEYYYKLLRDGSFYSNNNGDRDKTILTEEYVNKMKP